MKVKCSNNCCTCHENGHEWDSNQSSKYYDRCPMCNKAIRKKDYVMEEKMKRMIQQGDYVQEESRN